MTVRTSGAPTGNFITHSKTINLMDVGDNTQRTFEIPSYASWKTSKGPLNFVKDLGFPFWSIGLLKALQAFLKHL